MHGKVKYRSYDTKIASYISIYTYKCAWDKHVLYFATYSNLGWCFASITDLSISFSSYALYNLCDFIWQIFTILNTWKEKKMLLIIAKPGDEFFFHSIFTVWREREKNKIYHILFAFLIIFSLRALYGNELNIRPILVMLCMIKWNVSHDHTLKSIQNDAEW